MQPAGIPAINLWLCPHMAPIRNAHDSHLPLLESINTLKKMVKDIGIGSGVEVVGEYSSLFPQKKYGNYLAAVENHSHYRRG